MRSPLGKLREYGIGPRVYSLTDALRDVIHVNLGGSFDLFMTQYCLGVFHRTVHLQISAKRAPQHLESAELAIDTKLIRNRPHFPFEKILGTKRHYFPFIPEMPLGGNIKASGEVSGHTWRQASI